MNTKQCSRCKETLALDMFYRNKSSKDGIAHSCKKCHAETSGHKYTPKEAWQDGHRACTKCGEIKAFSEFNKAKNGRFGLDSRCRQCKSTAKPQKNIIDGYLECHVCKENKPATLEYFYYSKTSRHLNNLSGTCKVCVRKRTQDWQKKKREEDPDYRKKRYHKHREVNRRRSRAYYYSRVEADPEYNKQRYWENREDTLRRSREYYQANREELIERSRQWRQDNPERYREYNQQWAEDNPETYRAMMQAAWQRRRARKKDTAHDLTLEEWLYCLEYWKNQCAVCGADEDLHADHWIALSNEDCPGTVVDNMIPLCQHCNSTKHAIDAERWLTDKFGDEIASKKLAEVEAYFEHVIDRENDSKL